MRKLEYVLSVAMALLVLGGMVAWTQASEIGDQTASACRSGKVTSGVILRGMSIYPKCPTAKRG
jgi:hypothetical protein